MGFYRGPRLITNGLVLYLDAGNTKSYSGGTIWTDLSGYGNHGTLSGCTFDSSNFGSIAFNGNNYVSINDDPNLNFSIFTYSGWLLNTDTNLNWNRVLSKKDLFTDNDGYEISLYTGTGTDMYISGAGNTFAVINNINWINTGWHNLVVIFNNTVVSVYFDNVYKGQGNINPVVSNSRPLFLGKINSESTTQWEGKMGNVSMYNRVLSTSEVLQNFNALRGRYGI